MPNRNDNHHFIFVGKCRPLVHAHVYGRTVTHTLRKDSNTHKSPFILVRMAKLELDTHSIIHLFIDIIDYVIIDYNFVKKCG